MNEEKTISPQQSDESPVDPVVLASAMAAIAARGGKTRSMTVMAYPPQLLRDLCEKLADRRQQPARTLEWLTLECQDRDMVVPGQTAFYDFYKLVREQYRLANMLDRRKQAEGYVAAATEGNPEAQTLALNLRLTEILTDELMEAEGGEIKTDRLFALISGVKAVAAVVSDKRKTDARIAALEKMNQHRQATIELLQQRLEHLPEQVKAITEKLDHVEKAQASGKKVDASVYAAIRAELTQVVTTKAAQTDEGGAA